VIARVAFIKPCFSINERRKTNPSFSQIPAIRRQRNSLQQEGAPEVALDVKSTWIRETRAPNPLPPRKSTDCQFHIYGDPAKYPPKKDAYYQPPDATFEHMRGVLKALHAHLVAFLERCQVLEGLAESAMARQESNRPAGPQGIFHLLLARAHPIEAPGQAVAQIEKYIQDFPASTFLGLTVHFRKLRR